MNAVNYTYLFLSIFFLVLFFVYSSPAFSHEEHTFINSSEQRQKLEECLALPAFQDSCYFELCEDRNPYICTEDILDAVVLLAGPQKAMDVLNGIMDSSLFAIQTNGHLLSHVIGNAMAHHIGFSGEIFVQCPEGFNWGCTHGFFEDALKKQSDVVKAGIDICESIPERPIHRKSFCYHGIGHIFMFNESYNVKKSLSFCDQLPSNLAQQGCYQGVLMENQEYIFVESEDTIDGWLLSEERKETQGYRDDDFLAPCSRLEDKYRPQCYEMHGYYLMHRNNFSMKDASHMCLNDRDYTSDCITGISIMTTSTSWQPVLMEFNPIEPTRETTFIENAAHLCGMVPYDYIEQCQWIAVNHLMTYEYFQDASNFCMLYGIDKKRCFKYIGIVFHISGTDDTESVKGCEMMPEEYRDDCIEGSLLGYIEATRQKSYNNENPVTQSQNSADEQSEPETSSHLLYLFIVLGSILLITPLVYFYRTKKHLWSKYIGR